jgi:predicted ATP-dependent endonuclease of OLD family
MKMFKLGLKNLRRLRAIEPIEIRDITLLVGKNSSGKSSFLRTFPLLRQSTITRSSAPVLWYGDLVDFGNFETTVSDNDKQNEIAFEYVITSVSDRPIRSTNLGLFDEDLEPQPFAPLTVPEMRISVVIVGDTSSTKLSRIDVSIKSLNISSSILLERSGKVKSFLIDGSDITFLAR